MTSSTTERELDYLYRIAAHPGRWVLALVTLVLLGVFVVLGAALAAARLYAPVLGLLILVHGGVLLTHWHVDAWALRRYRRLLADRRPVQDAA